MLRTKQCLPTGFGVEEPERTVLSEVSALPTRIVSRDLLHSVSEQQHEDMVAQAAAIEDELRTKCEEIDANDDIPVVSTAFFPLD